MLSRRTLAAAAIAAAVTLAACGSSPSVRSTNASGTGADTAGTTDPTTPGTSGPTTPGTSGPVTVPVDTPAIDWDDCGADLDCGTMPVPLDYANPEAATITLKLVRARATDESERIGSLLVNPGGPGFGGTYLALSADAIFTPDLRAHFDIVGWDPRGTGESTPFVDCVDTYDEYFAVDFTPDDVAEQQILVDSAREFAGACAANNGDLLAHISTADTARDMDLIRRALGEEQISYFGFSYGSELGGTWATMFPDTVRAAVLDGAVDPSATGIQGSLDQAKGFEIAFDAFLESCRGSCDFAQGGDPGEAFDRIMADIDANQYPTEPGRPALNQGIAYIAVIEAMYAEFRWPDLADALEAARNGDGSGLLAFYDSYYQRKADGSYGNELEAFLAISCLDDPGPATVEEVDSFNDDFAVTAPRIGPSFSHGYACVGWPVPAAPPVSITGVGAGPIVVIGTTNDPATPFESSRAMAAALEGGLFVKVSGNGHTGYSQSPCAQDIVDRYLVDLEPPTADVDCN